jgi:DNA-directed RNA polymerase subunit RPC12/RpoP
MKRVLVDLAGNEVRTLVRGDRKALANQHAKLAPGDPFEVEVVRRMFRSYADGASLTTIAAALAADQVSSSKGSRWTPATVLYALRNEAYAGAVVYRHRDGQKPSQLVDLEERDSERFVRCVNAHPAIVERPLWESVQARLRAVSTRKTPSMLFQELHAARALWEQSDRISEEVVSVSDFRGGYGRPDSEIIGAKHVNAAVEKMIASIGETMLVTPFEDGYLLDHLLHLGIRVSLPHARYGGLRWSFPFTGRETEDLVLGLAFSPPPLVEHVETLVFRPSSKQARYASRPVLDSTAHRGLRQTRFPAVGAPLPPIRNAFRFRGVCAEMRFLEVVKGRPRICLSAVARELGWPAAATRTLYRKLDIRGESLPALTNGRGGKRLTVTCPHCLKKRSLRAKVVLSLKTDVCFECLHRPPTLTKNRFVAVCPDCGKRRLVPPWEAVKLSAGLETPCHACTMEKGRSLGRAVLASRRSS